MWEEGRWRAAGLARGLIGCGAVRGIRTAPTPQSLRTPRKAVGKTDDLRARARAEPINSSPCLSDRPTLATLATDEGRFKCDARHSTFFRRRIMEEAGPRGLLPRGQCEVVWDTAAIPRDKPRACPVLGPGRHPHYQCNIQCCVTVKSPSRRRAPSNRFRNSLLGREDSCFLHHRLFGYAQGVWEGR